MASAPSFVTSIREPVVGANVARYVRADVSRHYSSSGFSRDHHAILALLCRPPTAAPLCRTSTPREHRLMIHGMVDRPLMFTMDELKRLPYVTRVHLLECLEPRAGEAQDRPGNARVDQLRRMDRRAAVAVAQGGRRAGRR